MEIKDFIEKVIQGGYKFVDNPLLCDEDRERFPRFRPWVLESTSFLVGMRQAVLLDPAAWQSYHRAISPGLQESTYAMAGEQEMTDMVRALNRGKTIEEFLKTL